MHPLPDIGILLNLMSRQASESLMWRLPLSQKIESEAKEYVFRKNYSQNCESECEHEIRGEFFLSHVPLGTTNLRSTRNHEC